MRMSLRTSSIMMKSVQREDESVSIGDGSWGDGRLIWLRGRSKALLLLLLLLLLIPSSLQ